MDEVRCLVSGAKRSAATSRIKSVSHVAPRAVAHWSRTNQYAIISSRGELGADRNAIGRCAAEEELTSNSIRACASPTAVNDPEDLHWHVKMNRPSET